ncbi:hypothetical protein PF011_g20821 [Phytophthora fragariae]|uniref:Uncharacterized protein n=1 Tax=Phytophthora fragariae TaxID=53985 RepID=A0A6A3IW90_9STRA|nr:hypothetical protein PF011_g20821 [Phytophthora fragariae]
MTSTKEGKVPKTDVPSKIDCADLGLSLGGDIDSPPTFDMKGKPVSGAAKTLKNDPISLAALSLLVGTRNNLRSERQNVKPAASKTKTARALEVKVEDGDDVVAFVNKLVKPDSNQQQDGVGNQENTWPITATAAMTIAVATTAGTPGRLEEEDAAVELSADVGVQVVQD